MYTHIQYIKKLYLKKDIIVIVYNYITSTSDHIDVVNTHTTGGQTHPDVAELSNNQYAIAWVGDGSGCSNDCLYVRTLDSDCTKL